VPYIKREKRSALDPIIDGLTKRLRSIYAKKGDVNYCITRVVLEVLNHNSYSSLSDCVGVLRDAASEIERRLMAPYEDSCIQKNGDLQCLQSLYNTPGIGPMGDPFIVDSPLPKSCDCDGGCGDACKCIPPITECLTQEMIDEAYNDFVTKRDAGAANDD